jgi:hypothetical protein
MCPAPAFLAALSYLAQRKTNNMRIFNQGLKTKSPSPHHLKSGPPKNGRLFSQTVVVL